MRLYSTGRIFVDMSTIVTLWAHMVVTTILGRSPNKIEQSLPNLGLLIHEHITVHEIVPNWTLFCRYVDHCDPLGTHGRHEHFGEESQEIEQSLPILRLLIHEQISVHEILPYFTYFVVRSTMVTISAHMVVTTISGRSPKKSSSYCQFLDS